jgi:hypothetical protein
MKRGFMFAAVGLAVVLCAAALCVVLPDAASAATLDGGAFAAGVAKMMLANPALLALRSRHADLTTRAAAKLAEVKDDTPAADRTRIEGEHRAIADELATVNREIATIEATPPAPAPTDPVAVERTRTTEITRLALRHGMPPEFTTRHLADGTALDQVRTLVLDHVAAEADRTRISPRVQVVNDEGDTIRRAVESAIMLRANPNALPANAPEREMAHAYRGMSLIECGRTFLEETRGIKLRGLNRRELATVLLGLDQLGTRAAGMLSTSDFANILANVASRRLREAYALAPQNWKKIGRQSNNPDFKEKSVVQLSSAPSFKKVREGAEFTYGGLTDGVEKYALATYGRIIPITRQTLINDDLGAFDRLPMLLGRAAAELEANTFWSILTTNAAMNDAVALFHADHGNLAATGHAIAETGLTLGKKAMRTQKSLAAKAADREPLNLVPRYIVVSPDKEIEAAKMLTAILATQSTNVNVFAGSLEPIVEARLSGNGWYLVADPATIDTIEYAYLEGEEGVFTEQRIGFEVDGIEIKGRLDFAAKAIDHRGMYYDPGA